MQINTLFQKLRLPKLSQKAWITPKELQKYSEKVMWITRTSKYDRESYIILTRRISTLVKRGGFNFTFLYLKEAMRLIIRSLSGNPEPKCLTAVRVKRDHNGLPTIIPSRLRKYLMNFRDEQRIVVCILSIISVFRVFPTKVKPSLGTITEPFNGIIRTLDSSLIKLALAELTRKTKFSLRLPTLLQLESAGPNAVKSAWGASIDALAFVDHPRTLYWYIKYMVNQKSYGFIVWLILIIVASSPILFGLKVGGWMKRLNMGKLSVVYDQAGKARVVAITNWWIQVALKPLHNSIFKLLRTIDQDGTHNQHAPFNKLIEDGEGKFYSFDLSAATDRLPIDLQRDILNILSPNLGTLWSNLLDFEWTWKKTNRVRYAVGQPMGAYSSWAMLALTHHVIVRASALSVGLPNFKDYCVLGDDVVIRNDAVADAYYNLMKTLGVSINLSKSVNSDEFAEFAKVWKGPGVNITPIGPGLTLRLIRDKKYMAMYILEAWKLNIFNHFTEVLALVKDIRKNVKVRSEIQNVLWSSFGLNGFTFDSKRYIDEKSWMYCFSTKVNHFPTLSYRLLTTLRGMAFEDNREALENLRRNEEFFYQNWWRTFVTREWPLRLLEAFLKVVGPGFWIYALSFERSELAIKEDEVFITKLPLRDEHIWTLVERDPKLNLSSIDWTQKKLIKDNSRSMRRLVNSMKSFEETSFHKKALLNNPKIRTDKKVY
nr:MAG: putative RNA dependent RNA polymerase [Inner Mongolia grassland mitovirus 2]